MRCKVTARTTRILSELDRLSECVVRALHLASTAAREEWAIFRLRWPSEIERRQGTIALSDGELEMMELRLRRFLEILGALEGRPPDTDWQVTGDAVVGA
jgi:hypothetical protein